MRFAAALGEQRDRWALWLPVLLGCGIGGYFALPFEPDLGWTGAMLLALAVTAWGVRRHMGLNVLTIALLTVLLGTGLAGLRTWWVASPVIAGETGPVRVTGQVERVETLTHGLRVTLGDLSISRISPDATPKTVRVRLNGVQPDFAPGDWLELRAQLRPPPPPAMPGAFDFQRQSYFRELGGVGFSFGAAEVIGHAPTDGIASLTFAFERLRVRLGERVRTTIGGTEGALSKALMTGERGAIPANVMDDVRASGLAHLLAISGLHVGLVTGIVFFAVRAVFAAIPWFALRYPIKKWAAAVAICAAFGYALLAGATVPTQRAFLMVFLVLVAVMAERQAVSLRSVAWAALLILLLAPESLLGASFQMSFAAVVALVSVYETLKRRGFWSRPAQTWSGRIARYVGGVALTTLIAGVATGLIAAFHFNRVADYGLVANVIAVPVTALWVMPWAVAAYVLMPLGLEYLALAPMAWGVEVVLAVAHEVASWPGAVRYVPAFPVWGLALAVLGALWLALWRGRVRAWGAPVMALGLLSFAAATPPDVLIHQDGKLAAVRTPDGGYAVSTRASAKFERDIWLRRAGLVRRPARWDQSGDWIHCDGLGCVYRIHGHSVAFARTPEAALEDCWTANVLVDLSFAPARNGACPAAVRITPQDLAREGTHALWLDAGRAPRIETVNAWRGKRPWVVRTIR